MIYLALLFFKHYLADFVFQSNAMLKGKGIYGNPDGINHSLLHAVLTLWVTYLFTGSVLVSVGISLVDFIVHYHIDWVKMKYGCRDISNVLFWNHLGLDQLAHYLTYLGFATYLGV